MLRYLVDRFKQATGPLKQARLIAGDLAEEVLDLSDYYINRLRNRGHGAQSENHLRYADGESGKKSTPASEKNPVKKAAPSNATSHLKRNDLSRQLEVSKELEQALDILQYRKKQEFKVLAILFDAYERKTGRLSAKEVSEHGGKLGLSIRHENVRKVIRTRLDKKVDAQTVRVGSGSIYKYLISQTGIGYFKSKYLSG